MVGPRKYVPPHRKTEINEKSLRNQWKPEYENEFRELVPKYKHDWKKIVKRVKTLFNIKTNPNVLRNFYNELMMGVPK